MRNKPLPVSNTNGHDIGDLVVQKWLAIGVAFIVALLTYLSATATLFIGDFRRFQGVMETKVDSFEREINDSRKRIEDLEKRTPQPIPDKKVYYQPVLPPKPAQERRVVPREEIL